MTSSDYIPSPSQWVRDQVAAFEASRGAAANTLRDSEDPIVVITHRGAKTGAIRKIGLMRVEKDGKYLAVGSKGGAPNNPNWVHNFRAHPEMELQDGPVKKQYVARELAGPERDEWWDHAVRTWATYAEYQTKTSRLLPLFLLEPVE